MFTPCVFPPITIEMVCIVRRQKEISIIYIYRLPWKTVMIIFSRQCILYFCISKLLTEKEILVRTSTALQFISLQSLTIFGINGAGKSAKINKVDESFLIKQCTYQRLCFSTHYNFILKYGRWNYLILTDTKL